MLRHKSATDSDSTPDTTTQTSISLIESDTEFVDTFIGSITKSESEIDPTIAIGRTLRTASLFSSDTETLTGTSKLGAHSRA